MTSADQARAEPRIPKMGDNNPPPEDVLVDLRERHKPIIDRFAELTRAFETVPDTIEDDETAGKAGDLYKQMRTCRTDADDARTKERRPWQEKCDVIDAFFNKPREAMTPIYKDLKARIDKYMDEKKAKAKREKEEKARREKEERDRRIQEAAEAEARAKKAREDQLIAEAAERESRAKKEAADRAADEARRRVRRLAKIEPILKRWAVQRAEREAQKRAADEAERKRLADEAAKKAEDDLKQRQAEEARRGEQARQEARTHRRAESEARQDRVEAKSEAAHAERDADLEFQGAMRAEGRAGRLERQALSPSALTKVRGDLGSLGSQTRTWKFDVVDRPALSATLGPLGGYLHPEAVDAAVYKFMMDHRTDQGGPKLPGVYFEQVDGAVIR